MAVIFKALEKSGVARTEFEGCRGIRWGQSIRAKLCRNRSHRVLQKFLRTLF